MLANRNTRTLNCQHWFLAARGRGEPGGRRQRPVRGEMLITPQLVSGRGQRSQFDRRNDRDLLLGVQSGGLARGAFAQPVRRGRAVGCSSRRTDSACDAGRGRSRRRSGPDTRVEGSRSVNRRSRLTRVLAKSAPKADPGLVEISPWESGRYPIRLWSTFDAGRWSTSTPVNTCGPN